MVAAVRDRVLSSNGGQRGVRGVCHKIFIIILNNEPIEPRITNGSFAFSVAFAVILCGLRILGTCPIPQPHTLFT